MAMSENTKRLYVAASLLSALGSIVGVAREQGYMKMAPPQIMEWLYVIGAIISAYAAIKWLQKK